MDDPRADPTVSWMAMDIVTQLLHLTGDLSALARHLVCELRVLTGARCVLLVECQHPLHPLIDIEPRRRADMMEHTAFDALMRLAHDIDSVVIADPRKENNALCDLLHQLHVGISLIIPLRIGPKKIGAIVAFDLPGLERMHGMVEIFDLLAGIVALALRDSLRLRDQERLIAERTERLRVSEESYRTLTENLPDVVARYDLDARMLYVNANIKRMSGKPPAFFIGKLHRELGYSEGQAQLWDDAIAQVVASNRPFETEFELDGPQGRRVLDWRLIPEHDDEGRVSSVLGVARDITRERKAERSYRMLFESMLDGFALHEIICDDAGRPQDYRFLAVNPAFENLTGLKAEEIIGRTVLQVMPDTEARWIETYGRVALEGGAERFSEYSQELGKHFQVIAYQSSPGRFATIFQDVTIAKELEQRNHQRAKMEALGNLAGGIAHDFNNILQAILGYAHLARRDAEAGGRQEQAIRSITESGQRAADLVRQILAFSRQDEQSARSILLQEVVSEVLRMLRSTVPATITIDTEIDAACQPVLADPTAIHQVVLNLATNAVQAMKGEGQLRLRLQHVARRLLGDEEEKPCVLLQVSDSGCGMTEAVRQRIFDPFFTTKPQGEGTGMGLAMVHGIISRYGGCIEVESRPGEGSQFSIWLPVCLFASQTGSRESSAAHPSAMLGQGRVLFVDDEILLCELAQEFLGDAGCGVTAFSDPQAAWQAFEADPSAWDLIISDQTMPGMTGLELARRIKQLRGDLPVILCTGFSAVLDEESPLPVFDELIQKPYGMEDLVIRVRSWLGSGEA